MEHLITVSFSIHYVTVYGEELFISIDNGINKFDVRMHTPSLTNRKMTWNPMHLWTITIVMPQRTARWWYTVTKANEPIRVEQLELPREYDFDTHERYFQIVDHWNDYYTSVTPIVCWLRASPISPLGQQEVPLFNLDKLNTD